MKISEYKRKWMLRNGFSEKYDSYRKIVILEYKGYEWSNDDIENTSTPLIMKYKLWYDGLITEVELTRAIESETKLKTIAKNNSVKIKELILKGF